MSALTRAYERCKSPAQARHYALICAKNRNWPAAQLYEEVAEALEAAQRIRCTMALQGYICPTCGNTGRLDDIPCFHCAA